VILCAGWKDNFNIEDSLFAGALAEALSSEYSLRCDAGLAVSGLWSLAKQDLFSYIRASSHFNRLERLHIEEDVRFCMQLDTQQAVPLLQENALVNWNHITHS
jgi:2-phosphosulfolactate phosphatase